MLTTDFSGTYDYEKEEAEHEAEYIIECINDDGDEYAKGRIEKLRIHWQKVLDTKESFDDFCKHFNAKMPNPKFYI
jgi:hypothetical protein